MFEERIDKRRKLNQLAASLKNDRSSFDSHWRELGEVYAPRRTRFFAEDRQRGDKRYGKIINEHGMLAARTLRSGMFAGITSPARPWRRLTTPDPDLAEFGRVKVWLQNLNRQMVALDKRSNLYQSLPIVFGDTGIFGTSAMGAFRDEEDGMRTFTYPIGSYWASCNQRNVVDTFMREYRLTVRQIVMQFGDHTASEADKWKNFSVSVKDHWERGNYEQGVNVSHVVYPNTDADPRKLDAKFKRYASCYFETAGSVSVSGGNTPSYSGGDNGIYLKESGFARFPILVPRWEVAGEDVYGTSCPGMDALGSTKELQQFERDKSKAMKKMLNPPLKGPPSLRNQKVSLISGDITLVDERDGKNGLTPIHEVNVSLNEVNGDIERREHKISRAYYEDLFMMLTEKPGVQPMNEQEIAARYEEKLLALGPVLEGLNDDLLDPLTDIEFDFVKELGRMPPAPPELHGMPLKIEYESIMAKAQKLVGVAGTERFFGFVGNLAAGFPDVLNKVNGVEAVEEYADMMGVSPKIIRTQEEFDQIVTQKQQQMQKDKTLAAIPDLAKAGQNLSQADMSTDNGLTRMLAGA
jgi:hypothetical protein